MFAFLTKLFSAQPSKSETSLGKTEKNSENARIDQHKASETKQKQEQQFQQEQQKQMWKQKLDAVANNEAVVIEMLLACDFADGRLHAAQYVHSRQGLEHIKNAFKKSDKRVTKLAASRLEEMDQLEVNAAAVRACIEHAKQLLGEDVLLPNHLIQLDAQKEAVASFPAEFLQQFEQLRAQLGQRMAEQVQLQRRLLDLIGDAQQSIDAQPELADQKIEDWRQALSHCLTHALASSLPKHTVQEAELALQSMEAKLKQAKMQAENASTSPSEVAQTNALLNVTEEVAVVVGTNESVQPTDQTLPVKAIIDSQQPIAATVTMTSAQFQEALKGLEQALQDGSFQQARVFEKQLRDIDVSAAPSFVGRQQKDSLLRARKQFNHLLSWAKWSGDASREELVNTAEGLANLKLGPTEIVDTVTALRSQWKQMEASTGGAPKELWLRFDAACSAAYAPAAEHFQQQAELRKNNVLKAEQTLNQMQMSVDTLVQADKNWKAIGVAIQQMQQEWKRVGPVERKEKTRLDQQFAETIGRLTSIFETEQDQAIQRRRDLIQAIKALDANARNAADQVRTLQGQWQSSASHITLERKLEQELWTEFRAACDAVFDTRKQFASNAEQERQQHLQLKQGVCDKLEQFEATDLTSLLQFRQQIQNEWQVIGNVPRQEEGSLQRRFEQGLMGLQKKIQEIQQSHKQLQLEVLLKLMSLAHQTEAMATEHVVNQAKRDTLIQEWNAVDLPKNKGGRSLAQRWEQLLKIFEGAESTSEAHRLLNGNAIEVDHILLTLEILLQLESPANLAQERRQAQLEILQKSMKQGKDQDQVKTLLSRLLSVPVAFNPERQARIKSIIQQCTDLVLAN